MHTKLTRIGALLFILLLTFPAQAVTFWEDDFENHLIPNWDTSRCQIQLGIRQPFPDGCNASISAALAHSGTRSLRSDFNGRLYPDGGSGTKGTSMLRTHPLTNDLFVRFWYRTENYVPYHATTSKIVYHKSTGPDSGYWANYYGGRSLGFTIQHSAGVWCPTTKRNDAACNFHNNITDPPINDGKWYCMEFHMNLGTAGVADGVLEAWVDGTKTMHYTGIQLKTGASQWNLLQNITQAGNAGYRYMDDLAVGDTRIGCGTPLPPPPPPRNLTVQ